LINEVVLDRLAVDSGAILVEVVRVRVVESFSLIVIDFRVRRPRVGTIS
jgi:hypothetical protein